MPVSGWSHLTNGGPTQGPGYRLVWRAKHGALGQSQADTGSALQDHLGRMPWRGGPMRADTGSALQVGVGRVAWNRRYRTTSTDTGLVRSTAVVVLPMIRLRTCEWP